MTTNLSGSLSEFSLAEVLSLLGMGGRTARMQVTSTDAVGTVHLVDGRISSATADSARAGLLRSVVAALLVPADDLAQALQADDPVRDLVESGIIDRDAAGQVATEHCTEAIGTMLEWASGEFAVWVGAQDPSDIGVRLQVEDLVGAARERAQEWHDLRAALPAPGSVLALVPEVATAPVVDSDDWAVLARVDGRRTLAEVLAAMGASPLAAGNRLVQLMGRGLVGVHTIAVDAERDRTHDLLDAFEAGPVDGFIEVVPSAEPEFARDVHDLFDTQPEAVEEWQSAGADSWVVAEMEPGTGPTQYDFTSVELAAEHVGFEAEAPSFDVGIETEPTAYDLDPVPDEPEPIPFEPNPVGYAPEPIGYEAVAYEPEAIVYEPETVVPQPEAYDVALEAPIASIDVEPEVEPVIEPVAESFAWSPWAQEMGLGEAAPVAEVAALPVVGQGFADMVQDGAGHGHTDAFPTPQSPVAGPEQGTGAAVGFGGVDEVTQFVPQPRDPGDGLVDSPVGAHSGGVHAAGPQNVAAPEMLPGARAGEPTQEPAPDPLAGGLLAHLMSSVRGM